MERYLAYGENTRPTLVKRVCRSWFGVVCEVVITGLTRKRLGLVTFIYPQSLETLHFFGILSAEISEVGRQFSIKIPTIRFHMESYLAYGENTHTLRLTSELVDLRVGYAKWIRTTSCPSQSISAPYEIENFIRRDIEVVITGLTRNFVVTLEPPTLNPLIYKGFARSEYNLIA